MKKLRKSILASLGLLPFLMPMDVAAADKTEAPTDDAFSSAQELPWRKARFSLEMQSGSRTIGSFDALVPFMGNDDFMVYTNLIARFGTGANNSNGNTLEGNLGLGVRRVNDSETAIYGAYAFFDYLNSVNENTFQQITVGAERLGMTWDFRVNAYVPIGTKSYTSDDYSNVIIDKHNLIEFYKTRTETVTTGGDIEVGRTLGSQKLRGYLAAYSFGKDLTGSRLRFEYALNDTFSLNAAVQYDKDRGTQYLLGARFTIGGAKAKNSNSIYSRLTTQVVRDVDVVTQQTVIDNSKIEIDKFWMVDADQKDQGDGTIENPFKYLDEAIEQAPDGAIIFVKSKDGKINRLREHASLKDGQVLWGGSETLYWDFKRGVPVFSANEGALVYEAEGVRQTIGGGIDMADNSFLYNFDFVANDTQHDSSGIHVDNKKNVTIGNVSIDGFQSGDASNPYSAISITGANADVSFANVTLTNNDIGISIDGGDVSFNDITISHSGSYGIKADKAKLDANNITIEQSGISGVLANDSNITANNLSIAHSLSGAGYEQHGGSATFTDSISVTDSAKDGMYLDRVSGQSGDATIEDNQGNGYVQHGGDMAFANLTVNGSAANGVSLTDAIFSAVDISLDGNLGDGSFHADDSEVSANSISIDNTTNGDGYYQHGGKATIAAAMTVKNSGGNGIWLDSVDAHVDSISVDSNAANGIYQTGGAITVEKNVSATKSGLDGFNVSDASVTIKGTADFSGNGISPDVQDQGYGLKANNADITIDSITANTNYLDGLNLLNSHIVSASVTTNGNNAYGFVIDGSKDGQLNQLGVVTTDGNLGGNGFSMTDASATVDSIHASDNTFGYGVYVNHSQLTITSDSTIEKNKDGIVLYDSSTFNADDLTVNENVGHGLQINDGSIATVKSSNFTSNGLASIDNAKTIEDLSSAIDIVDGELHATHITVTGNAGGIKLEKGSLAINENTLDGGQRSILSGNQGYGVYASNTAQSDASARQLLINNTDINSTEQIENITGSGYGIQAEDVASTELNDVNINLNEMGGIKIDNHDSDVQLTITASHIDNNKGTHGVEVDGANVDINLDDITIEGSDKGVGLVAIASDKLDINGKGVTIDGNGAEGVKAVAENAVDMTFENSTFNGNTDNGIYAVSNQDHVDVSITGGSVNSNGKDGIHMQSEAQSPNVLGKVGLQNRLTLDGTDVKDNTGNGVYLNQRTRSTAIDNYTNAKLTGNGDGESSGDIYVTNGTLTGTLENTEIDDTKFIQNINLQGDFARYKPS